MGRPPKQQQQLFPELVITKDTKLKQMGNIRQQLFHNQYEKLFKTDPN
jgi:hypothetical protein